MKKWLVLFTVLCCLTLWGCGNKDTGNPETTGTTGSSESVGNQETTEPKATEDNKVTEATEDTKETEATKATEDTKETEATKATEEEDNQKPTDSKEPTDSKQPTENKDTAHQHTFGEWKVTKASTCSSEGVEKRTCAACKAEESRSVAKAAHTFGEWIVATKATCTKEGKDRRTCSVCWEEETRSLGKADHTYSNGKKLCGNCWYVDFSGNEAVVEMGNVASYSVGNDANIVWDVKIWDGKIYRGAGDYDKNSGATAFIAFDLETNKWKRMETATDEAIHCFVEIDGKLYAPGIDSNDSGGWNLGNYYVLENGKWNKVRNVPNGIHCFDMIGFGGKMYIGVGTETVEDTVGVSSDGGQSWSYLPLAAADGTAFDTSPYEWSRTYAFAEYNGTFHALLQFKQNGKAAYDMLIFRYENGKMVYESKSNIHSNVGRNYWQSAFEWKGTCYLTSKSLYAVTDFTAEKPGKPIQLPDRVFVSDALVYNDEMYVLSYMEDKETGKYKVIIYKSSTGAAGSFTTVASFDYVGIPYSFDFDGSYFYVGIGRVKATEEQSKVGMMLRVKPNA